MESPTLCPLCGDVLLNEYKPGGYLEKTCDKKVGHTFICSGRPFEPLKVKEIFIFVGAYKELVIHWNLAAKILLVHCPKKLDRHLSQIRPPMPVSIPFIEFDLKDPFKVINKIKTLLPFI